MAVPDWWTVILLSAAAWRTFQLVAFDSILDQPRRYVTRLGKKWEKEGDVIPKEYREKWALFLTCPYCLGFWVGLAWWGAWQLWPHGTLVVAAPWVISVGVISGHKLLKSDE